ncbi:MAG: methyltransferase domain-containing protein [Acidobacteriota bacterium]|nr:methyltransferase domain-containing protein [Acidobacteriota bacterium]
MADASPDWWKSFFSGLIVDFWKVALPPEVTRLETDFLMERLALAAGDRVLDAPCGHGRLAIELARRGCAVTGVDISSEFLAEARSAADDAGAEVARRLSWRESDMRDLPWRDHFQAAFCMGGSFGYFGDEGDAEYLAAVAGALVPGGLFALDGSRVAETILPDFHVRREFEKDGLRFESENRYDPQRGRIENRYTITRGSLSETRTASHRLYTVSQLLEMLRTAGLEPQTLSGSLDGIPFRMGSSQLFVVARRAEK